MNTLFTQGLSLHVSRFAADYVNSSTSLFPANVGGNYNSNDNYGMFYFNANNNASNTNGNLGSRHLVMN